MDNLRVRVDSAFRNYTLHINVVTLPRQPRGYTPADAPTFHEDRGPACGHLPLPPWDAKHPIKVMPNLADGVDTPNGKGGDRAALGYDAATGTTDSAMGYAGSPAETQVLKTLLGPVLGEQASDVSDLGALLVAPMARGAKVSVR